MDYQPFGSSCATRVSLLQRYRGVLLSWQSRIFLEHFLQLRLNRRDEGKLQLVSPSRLLLQGQRVFHIAYKSCLPIFKYLF